MNKHLHRIIFSAARGQRMVVAETAHSQGGAGSGETGSGCAAVNEPWCSPTSAAVSASLTASLPGPSSLGPSLLAGAATAALTALAFGVLVTCAPAHGQIRADASAPGAQRPTVLQTANGTPQVNIQTPSAAGVSRNIYSQFDVLANGAVLNNSRTNSTTRIAGIMAGNPWLASGTARVILNEVNSSNPSYLKGPVEVAGQRAEVIIANPSGIRVNGGSFINAAGVTLTTGTPVMNAGGDLESFRVQQGMVTVEGLGLDTSTADYTRILARATEVNAGLWAKHLTVVTGANEVKAASAGAHVTATPIAGTGAAPRYMLDVAAIGGMYAGHIFLVGTEAGLGVNNRGTMAAQEGQWVLRADGWLVNTGKVQAKGDVTVNVTGAVSNTGAEAVLSSQGNLAITSGASIANAGGAVIAANGTLEVKAGGAVANTGSTLAATGAVRIDVGSMGTAATATLRNTAGGRISSESDLSLSASDIHNTDSKLQALGDLTVRATTVQNTSGIIEANGHVTLDATTALNNIGGTLSAGRNLTVQNTAASRTLAVTNTGGTLRAGAHTTISSRSLTGDGAVQAAADLTLDLQSDFDSTTDLVAGGQASVTTTGSFTNRARLNAGQTVTASAAQIINTATGEIAGNAATRLTATTELVNRGLIDGADTRIQAGTVTNIGTGRLYGDHLAIAAGTLTNDTETLSGVRADAVIAARERLDLGVGTLTNREHALIFSAGSSASALNIGGALDASGHATGNADALYNASATVESLGGLTIAATRLYNTNEHFATAEQQVGAVTSLSEYTLGAGDVYRGSDLSTHFLPSEVTLFNCEADCIRVNATGDQSDAFVHYQFTRTPYETVVTQSDPGRIIAGGAVQLTAGTLVNDRSQILAGGALNATAADLQNTSVAGERRFADSGTATSSWRHRRSGRDTSDTAVAAYTPADTIQAITLTASRLEGNASVAGSGTQVAVRVVTPDPGTQVLTVVPSGLLSLPASSLLRLNPDPTAGYLVVTDPRFTDMRLWLGSDYMLSLLAVDPTKLQKRLGDGFYEQRLIREQVAQLTGRRFLDGFADDEAQFRALMNSGVTFAQQWRLVPGVALSAEQMARLTSDIVWLVAQEVVLPDGSRTTALVPQVYVRAQAGDLAPGGALLAGRSVNLDLSGDLSNSGTIAGRQAVVLNAQNMRNLGGQVQADAVSVSARTDLSNIGGSFIARDSLEAMAGRDLIVESTTRSTSMAGNAGSFTRTGIDRVAGLYVTGDGGALVASAGRDAKVVAGVLQSQGSIAVQAGINLNLATVTTAQSGSVAWNAANWRKEASTQEAGSQITAAGDVRLTAGNDLTARAATVNAGGALTATAGRNLNVEAGQATRETEEAASHKSRSFLSSRTITTHEKIDETQAVGSSLGGNTVNLPAGQDLGVRGSSVISDQGSTLAAGRNVTIEAATNTVNRDSDRVDRKSGLFSGGGFGITLGTRKLQTDQQSESTTAAASTVGSVQGDVHIKAGQTYRQTGSDVLAPGQASGPAGPSSGGNVDIRASKIEIMEARETATTVTQQKFSQSGLTLQITNPVVSAVQTAQAMTRAAENTRDDRMKLLAAANTALAARNALEAVKSGQGQDFAGRSHQVVTEDATGNLSSRDATASERVGGINVSLSLGNSTSSSTTTETRDAARGSQIAAGGSVRIQASGAGADSKLLIQGSDLKAGGNASLQAEGDVTLRATQDKARLTGSNRSSSGSIGVSVGTSGVGVTASASAGRGSQAGDDVTQRNAHVSAGGTASLRSGADTSLQGAVVQGATVQAEVGGNLNITSLQDTSTYAAKQQSAGASLTVGAGSGGSFNAAKSSTQSSFASVTEQSGIKAGDGGFQVSVGQNTDLKGGVIASTQAAVDQGKNSFTTGGNLSTTDIQNSASYSVKATSVGVSTGDTATLRGNAGLGVGTGSDKASAASTTQAGISGIAGNAAVRSTDGETGLQRIFDKDKVQRDVDAQATITEAFSRQAPKAVADFAASQTSELKRQLQAEPDPEKRAALQADIARWDEGGAYRVLLHSLSGAMVGGLGGAAGAAASAGSANLLSDLQQGLQTRLESSGLSQEAARAIAQGVTTLTATGVGAAAGGAPGAAAAATVDANNRQLHPSETQWIQDNARRYARQQGISEDEAIRKLSQQAYRQVQFGAEGAWDASASAFLSQARGMLPATDASEPGYLFQATVAQKADFLMYAQTIPSTADIYIQAGIKALPDANAWAAAVTADQSKRNLISWLTAGAGAASALISLAGASPTLLAWALSDPAKAVQIGLISAETGAGIASGAITPTSVAESLGQNLGRALTATEKAAVQELAATLKAVAQQKTALQVQRQRIEQLTQLFSKNGGVNSLNLGGRSYVATAESNFSGTTKVFDTTGLSATELERQVFAYAGELAGGATVTPVLRNGVALEGRWSVKLADGTTINVRSVSSSQVGRWTIELRGSLPTQNELSKYELKFQ
jgi:filamentous hemagglutinin